MRVSCPAGRACVRVSVPRSRKRMRSEEHTSELQSRLHLVCRLLLEKKKNYLDRFGGGDEDVVNHSLSIVQRSDLVGVEFIQKLARHKDIAGVCSTDHRSGLQSVQPA